MTEPIKFKVGRLNR